MLSRGSIGRAIEVARRGVPQRKCSKLGGMGELKLQNQEKELNPTVDTKKHNLGKGCERIRAAIEIWGWSRNT
jgi:hypothetical protein